MCPFCDKDEPIRENKLAKVFLSDPHKVPGHVLVMPKRHIEMPWEMTPEELQACFEPALNRCRELLNQLVANNPELGDRAFQAYSRQFLGGAN